MAFSVAWFLEPEAQLQIHNSVLSGRSAMAFVRTKPLDTERLAQLEISQCTLVGHMAIRYDARVVQTNEDDQAVWGDAPTLRARIANSIIDTEQFFYFSAPPGRFAARPGVRMRILLSLFDWQEDGNFYREGMEMATVQFMRQRAPLLPGENDLAQWQTLFDVDDPRSTQGTVEYETMDGEYRHDLVLALDPSPPDGPILGAKLEASAADE